MKSSAIKIINSFWNKKNANYFKKITNITNSAIVVVVIIIIIASSYFLRPFFFDYVENKEIVENKIETYLKTKTNISGDISYRFFPKTKITAKNVELHFTKSKKKPLILKEVNFLVSLSSLNSLEDLQIKKVLIKNQEIEIFSNQFKNYTAYFQKKSVNNLIFKNCDVFFLDKQGNRININKLNLINNQNLDKENISLEGIFSKKKFKINLVNPKNDKKFLDFTVPDLDTKLKIAFDKTSTLNRNSGKLNLKIFNNVLLLNFNGEKIYQISDSFFRNEFLSSKLNGNINFEDDFYFDLTSIINQVNLRKLFRYYNSFIKDEVTGQLNLSKKINGKINVTLKSTDTYLGRLNNANFILLFENGDLKINNGSADIGKNSKLKFNISVVGKGKNQKIGFFLSFLSEDGKKFARKFNTKTQVDNLSLNTRGKINVVDKRVKFENLFINGENVKEKRLKNLEDVFNQNVINENILGFLEFFKMKKFVNEAVDF